MLQLLNPIWLFSLAALAVPVVIHLWNVKQGKTLRIGSISLLGESSRQNAKSFKLNDLLLLFLRCLLLAGITLLLSKPVWRTSVPVSARGWMLLEHQGAVETYGHFKKNIDSLAKAGYELHYFEPGFRKAKLEELATDTLSAHTNAAPPSYWSLLHRLENDLPPGKPVRLFTANQARRISGKRPTVSFLVTWETYIPADSTATWLHDAYLTTTDSLAVTIGKSTPSGNTLARYMALPGDDHPLFSSSITNGKPVVILKTGETQHQDTISADTATMRIAVASRSYPDDARYVKAALGAVKSFTGRRMNSTGIENLSNATYIFWLDDAPFPYPAPGNAKLIRYQPGKATATGGEVVTGSSTEKIGLLKRTAVAQIANKDEILWTDGSGDPLLVKSETGKNSTYRLYTHLNPAWNDLVWNNAFPQVMLDLLLKNKPVPHALDRSALPVAQYLPVREKMMLPGNKITPGEATPLSNYLWLILVGIFAIERLITYKQQTELSYAGK